MAKRNLRASEHGYKLCGPTDRCAYCGDPAEEIDHAVPKSIVSGKLNFQKRFWAVKCAACSECNGFATDLVHSTFLERRRTIARKVRATHKRSLETAHWTPEEIARLGRMMGDVIACTDARAQWLRYRLRVLDSNIMPEGIPFNLANRHGVTAENELEQAWEEDAA